MMGGAHSTDLFLGVDVGTTGLKVGAFNESGEQLASGSARYSLSRPRAGWVEQDANDWLTAFEEALGQVLKRVDGKRVRALCPVGQSPTVVPVDAEGRPVRPAITWADARAAEQARQLSTASGSYVNVEFAVLPRIMWLRDSEPDSFANTRWFFQAADFLSYHLTGKAVIFSADPQLAPWTDDSLAAANLDPYRFPPTVSPGEIVGQLAPDVSERLGLNPKASLVSGTVDAFAHWIGVDLSRPGRVCNIGGTSEGANMSWPEPLNDPQHRLFTLPSPFGSGWVVGGSMSNGGSVLDWAVGSLFGSPATREQVLDAVSGVTAGSQGLVALPYLLGERTPIYDLDARGVFLGLGHEHGAAHLTRALLEGVALGLRQIIELIESLGGSVDDIVVSGGTSNASVWNRIKANVTGKPVKVPTVHDSGVLGAAMLARSAVSQAPLTSVATEMAHFSELIEPTAAESAVYDDIYPLFLDLYGRMREPFKELARLRQEAYVGKS